MQLQFEQMIGWKFKLLTLWHEISFRSRSLTAKNLILKKKIGPQKGSFLPNIYFSGMSHFLYHLFLNVNIVLSLQQANHSHLCSGGSSCAGLEFGVPQTLAMASARPATLSLVWNRTGLPKTSFLSQQETSISYKPKGILDKLWLKLRLYLILLLLLLFFLWLLQRRRRWQWQ